jgi:succinoglycan biosynthesis transport protein ExoP
MASADDRAAYGLQPPPGEHVSLPAVLRRRALIIVVTALLCVAAAAAFAYVNRDNYESTAKLLFRQQIGPELSAVGIQVASPDADNLAQDAVGLTGARRVAQTTADDLGGGVSVQDVEDDVTVSGNQDSEVVDIVASATSARGAAELASAYAAAAARLVNADQTDRAERVLDNVRTQLDELPADERRGSEGARLQGYIERLRALAESGTGNPQIVQEGVVPTERAGNPLQTIALGVLFGIVLGVGIALVREQADRRLHRTEDVSAAFDAPVLATVPRDRALKRHVAFSRLPPHVSEAFRILQTNLRFGQSQAIRSVLVTSSRNGEGKTTVAWNLACAASTAGLSVVVVEADMRRPTLAGRYGLEAAPGLSDAARGDAPVVAAIQAVMPVPGISGTNGHPRPLHVVVAGASPPNPWALMQSPTMVRILEALQSDHDLVVIDTPPIPYVADAIALLHHVDGVIVTASINSTSGPEAGRLRDQLRELDANVLGVVANGGAASRGYAYAAMGDGRVEGAERSRSSERAADRA